MTRILRRPFDEIMYPPGEYDAMFLQPMLYQA